MPQRLHLSWVARLLCVSLTYCSALLLTPSNAFAQEDTPDTSLSWWVIGTGGVFDAVSADGDTLSATIGQAAVDTTSESDSSLGKPSPGARSRRATTVHLGFWLPKMSQSSERSTATSDAKRTLTAFPNPFATTTTIRCDIDGDVFARLHVFDVAGNVVRSLQSPSSDGDVSSVSWDGRSDDGLLVPSGVYYCRLDIATNQTDFEVREHLAITVVR